MRGLLSRPLAAAAGVSLMLPVNRGSAGSDTSDMPIGHLCRSCVVVFVTEDDVDRYLFAAPILVVGLMIALARWNDL